METGKIKGVYFAQAGGPGQTGDRPVPQTSGQRPSEPPDAQAILISKIKDRALDVQPRIDAAVKLFELDKTKAISELCDLLKMSRIDQYDEKKDVRKAAESALRTFLISGLPKGPVSENGKASFYGRTFHGKRTYRGEKFDMNDTAMAASVTLPMGTVVLVRRTTVKVQDFIASDAKGNIKKQPDRIRGQHILDQLSEAGFIEKGQLDDKLKILPKFYDSIRTLKGDDKEKAESLLQGKALTADEKLSVYQAMTRSIVAVINDNGGFKKYDRIIDLSQAGAESLGMKKLGVMEVEVIVLKVGDGKRFKSAPK